MRLESLTLKECLDFSSYLNKSEVKPCIGWFSANAGDIRYMGPILGLGRSLEKGMTTHSSVLAWRIHGHRSLEGYSPQGHKESDMTEVT